MNKIVLEQQLRMIGVKATEAAKIVREEQVGWVKKLEDIQDIILEIIKEYLSE